MKHHTKFLITSIFLVLSFLVGFLFGNQFDESSGTPNIPKTSFLSQTVAYEKPQRESFLRVREEESLETAVASYVPISGADLQVDLVAAVHVAEDDYFTHLNKLFTDYEAVLYELVAPPGVKPSSDAPKSNDLFSIIQQMMPKLLGLEHQLEKIDYHVPNFVHADLSFQDLGQEVEKRGDNTYTLALGTFLDFYKMNHQFANSLEGEEASAELAEMKDLKKIFVKAFEMSKGGESLMSGFSVITPYLVEARNNRALEVLEEQIEAGKKKIAIFYGAAHLPDLEVKLLRDFGLMRKNTSWIPAWDLTKESPEMTTQQLTKTFFELWSGQNS